MRVDGRNDDELRRLNLKRNILDNPDASVLVEMGKTKIIVTAMVEQKVPIWMKGSGNGWLTAEYAMLPGSTNQRKQRDSTKVKPDGRGVEIQRLIGRVLRSAIDLTKIGERTIWIDADVIQADGGTRTAAITGGFVALFDVCYKMYKKGEIDEFPIDAFLGAVSVGKVKGDLLLDLCYIEDSQADVDMNLVMNEKGEFSEIQSSAEGDTFNEEEFIKLLHLGKDGINEIIYDQKLALEELMRDLKNEKNSISNE